jgi:hypothetical protein
VKLRLAVAADRLARVNVPAAQRAHDVRAFHMMEATVGAQDHALTGFDRHATLGAARKFW